MSIGIRGLARTATAALVGAGTFGAGVATFALVSAAPAQADPDIDFAAQLHTYGIYGPRDYNAWIGKIVCKRLYTGVDPDAFASAAFVAKNLPKGSTTQQAWQFIGAAINTYCPDQIPVLLRAADQPA